MNDNNFVTPEPDLPFTITDDGSINLVELNSDAEIQNCVFSVLGYEPGQLITNPDFGTPSQAFKRNGVDLSQLQGIVQHWEPRAREVFEHDPLWFETLVDTVTVRSDTSDGG